MSLSQTHTRTYKASPQMLSPTEAGVLIHLQLHRQLTVQLQDPGRLLSVELAGEKGALPRWKGWVPLPVGTASGMEG